MLYATMLFVVSATIVGGATAATPPPATALTDIASTTASPRVRIDSGELIGVTANGVDAFKGIPYAAPPVGDLRWRSPQSPSPWHTPRVM